MKLYCGANSDGTEIISKQPLKRYIDYETNKEDVLSFSDTQRPPHWMLDYDGIEVPATGIAPIGIFMDLPHGSLKKMFGIVITWEDNIEEVEL